MMWVHVCTCTFIDDDPMYNQSHPLVQPIFHFLSHFFKNHPFIIPPSCQSTTNFLKKLRPKL